MFRLKFYILGYVVYFCREKAANRYGFVEKVVDGMFVQINSVIISFKFQAFLATFQMSRLFIQSTNPKWEADDLRNTRVKDETRGEVLTFKEITWSTLRIDANALYDVRKYLLFIFFYKCIMSLICTTIFTTIFYFKELQLGVKISISAVSRWASHHPSNYAAPT